MGSWGEQYSSGDQSRTSKEAFWRGGFKTCCSCNGGNITSKTDVAGCRNNGDGYGTEVFTCKDCGWETSFQYDEAGDIYYYETRTWRSDYVPPRPRSPKKMTEDDVRKFNQLRKLAPLDAVRVQMYVMGFSEETIDAFLSQS